MRVETLLLLSISKRSLLDETKAISIPEKNAENAIEISICIISPIFCGTECAIYWLLYLKVRCLLLRICRYY